MKIKPMAILLTMLAGCINRQQTEVIEYLLEENKILREKWMNFEPFPEKVKWR